MSQAVPYTLDLQWTYSGPLALGTPGLYSPLLQCSGNYPGPPHTAKPWHCPLSMALYKDSGNENQVHRGA